MQSRVHRFGAWVGAGVLVALAACATTAGTGGAQHGAATGAGASPSGGGVSLVGVHPYEEGNEQSAWSGESPYDGGAPSAVGGGPAASASSTGPETFSTPGAGAPTVLPNGDVAPPATWGPPPGWGTPKPASSGAPKGKPKSPTVGKNPGKDLVLGDAGAGK